MELTVFQYLVLGSTTFACISRVLCSYIIRRERQDRRTIDRTFPALGLLIGITVFDITSSVGLIICEVLQASQVWVSPCLAIVTLLHLIAWILWLCPLTFLTKFFMIMTHFVSAIAVVIGLTFMVQLGIDFRFSLAAIVAVIGAFVYWVIILSVSGHKLLEGDAESKRQLPSDSECSSTESSVAV